MEAAPTSRTSSPFDHAESFPSLSRPPIVEAVIQINGQVGAAWEEAIVGRALSGILPEYSRRVAFNAMRVTLAMEPGSVAAAAGQAPEGLPPGSPIQTQPVAKSVHTGFDGVRLETPDGKWVAQFTRGYFALSRLAPYESWAKLSAEAIRLWSVYKEIGRVEQVNRVSCRFINRLDVKLDDSLLVGQYFKGFEEPTAGFRTVGFMHQTMLMTPEHPYVVNLIRTHQPPQSGPPAVLPLILDLEAFVAEQTTVENAKIEERLAELRCVKNRVFFASITDRARSICGEDQSE